MGTAQEVYYTIDKLLKYGSDNSIDTIHEYNIDITANHIFLFGEESYMSNDVGGEEPGVEFGMANRFIRNLNILMRKSEKPILIHMKTNGGFWEEGMAIYDAIKACPNNVTILNYSHARSMSSIILQAADKRVMMPSSSFMYHDGTMGFSGTSKQYLNEAEQLKLTMKIMVDIYIDSIKAKSSMSHRTRAQIRTWLRNQMDRKEDVYLTASEAVDLGLADEVFGISGHYDWSDLTKF